MDLPVEDRTVKTITYVGTFSDEQRKTKEFARTQDRDKGLTSDEELLVAARKDAQIGQLMELVGIRQFFCSVHSSGHNATGTKQDCYVPPSILRRM
jgi:hypothetical protein